MLEIDTVTGKAGLGPRTNHVAAEIEETDDEFVTMRHPFSLRSPCLAELAEQSFQHRLRHLQFSSEFLSELGRLARRVAPGAIQPVLLATPVRNYSALVA